MTPTGRHAYLRSEDRSNRSKRGPQDWVFFARGVPGGQVILTKSTAKVVFGGASLF